LDIAVTRRHSTGLPLATFAINVSGAFLLGLVTGLAVHHGLGRDAETVLGVGLLGGYTTWSTFAVESVALAEQRRTRAALANVVGSLAIGLAAGAAGLGLALI
jgi:CrcB protein